MINKAKFKPVLQKHDYDCGVASALAMNINSGISELSYTELSKKLNVTRRGVPPANLEKYFLKLTALKPEVKLNSTIADLRTNLKRGRICMVMYQSWGKENEIENLECGHYSVAVGIEKSKLYLLDPTAYKNWGDGIGWRVMALDDFEKKWIDKDYSGKIFKGWMLSIEPLSY